MSNNTQLPVPQRQRAVVEDSEALFDTGKFEHMARIAGMMARATMLPDHLRVMRTENGALVTRDTDRNVAIFLDVEATTANAFLIVNQARLFGGIDPFALAQSTYFVHGKLGYEGKLVQAVLERRIGPMLFQYFGTPGNEAYGITVTAWVPSSDPARQESVTGTVADWQTKKNGVPLDQWKGPAGQTRMLHYRGTREWARMHAPGLALGLLDEDDLAQVKDDFRAQRARPAESISNRALQGIGYNPLRDEEADENAEERARATEPTKAPAEPAKPTTAAQEPAQTPASQDTERSGAPAGEDTSAPTTFRRAPRGAPQRMERLIMDLDGMTTLAAVNAHQDGPVAAFLTELRTAGVNIVSYQEKLEERCATRRAVIDPNGKAEAAASASADPETGEVSAEGQTQDFDAILKAFRQEADKATIFDHLDDAVVNILEGHDLPAAVDAEVDTIIHEARVRIADAMKAPAPDQSDDFPGDREFPQQGDVQTKDNTPAPASPSMTDDEVQEMVDGWGTAMRKCKTSADLAQYNADVITPFMQGPDAGRIDRNQLTDVQDTYKNRFRLLTGKEKDAAKS